ncbi:retrotransposon-like protein 1 [Entomophthora muscae]|uniref:Retrotransposon-like protein 1 n=1 Tax=Entomophthora muscae TaxID=34485 RepID=A0ACC2RTK0_9FUNG|nr:retrotransposon-like protein 1 [Entomophthora muscae]
MTPEELQRHYREGLCFHCHKAGHLTRACPKKNPAPISLALINTSSQSYKFILVSVNVRGTIQKLKAFIDTGVDESFIDANLAQELGLSASEDYLQIIMENSTKDIVKTAGLTCQQGSNQAGL